MITPKTKAILLNSPVILPGMVINRDILEKVSEIAKEHNLFIISDELYERIYYLTEENI